jgi:hypothetical protein
MTMADQNCPVCGHANPEKSETCQKCGANLFWLEAEPDAALAPQASISSQEDTNGAGLPGIDGSLPSVPAIFGESTAIVQPHRLQVSETQKGYVALLEKMTDPGRDQPVHSQAEAARRPRWLLLGWGILLIATLMISMAWPGFRIGISAIPSEVLAVNRSISKIPDGAPVLVAVDYQPAFTAEMEMASVAVLDQLAAQGTSLVFISTNPGGFWQAEHLMHEIEAGRGLSGGLPEEFVYHNLGYLPGGALGLANFIQQPSQTIEAQLPSASGDEFAAQAALLEQVTSINDFEAIFVLTEDPDTARDWLEQVQPYLTHPPLLMILSAQAEPMFRPYLEMQPPRIQGMIVGINGGVAYENLSNQVQSARQHQTASVMGNVLGGIILTGALAAFLVYNQWNQQAAPTGRGKKE